MNVEAVIKRLEALEGRIGVDSSCAKSQGKVKRRSDDEAVLQRERSEIGDLCQQF